MKRKIDFPIVRDDDGYPPVESIWAEETSNPSHYVIDSIPFFTRQATIGDVVRVKREGESLVFERVISKSTSSLIRVIAFDPSAIEGIRAELARLGCSTEWFGQMKLIAVEVPAAASIVDVQEYLADLEKREVVSYEEPILRHPIRN